LDHNGLQIDGDIKKVMNPEDVSEKFRAFRWHVIKIDGHNLDSIYDAIREAKTIKDKPTMIVCATHKGQGVSFMTDEAGWHGSAPKQEQRDQAIDEIDHALIHLQEVCNE
jgi:transketolase